MERIKAMDRYQKGLLLLLSVMAVVFSLLTAASMLFADELFRWNLAFQIRNVEKAEPSDWEIAGRYLSWTVLTLLVLGFYIGGLS